MAVGHLPLRSFWANEVIFQLMMLAYNLFLLFKMDFAGGDRIPAADQDLPIKEYFLGREDHQNGEKCGD